MADSDLLRNLTAAGLQMACLAVLAEVLLRVVPVAAAGFRYAYWRAVLAAALAAPWLLRATPDAAAIDPVAMSATALPVVPVADVSSAVVQTGTSWLAALPWLLAAGAAARLLWLATGLVRLRVLRRSGAPVDDAAYAELQDRLGARADIRVVPTLGQPVTFGVWRPVVLLPLALATADATIRRAAVAHELVHVQRRDWLFVLGEELLRAILWFHPAIWWMTARVRLTREEFTDHLAVLATGSRRSYIDALLAFADASDAAPAPAFIRRAHLFHRIVLLTKEPAMSSRRIVTSGIVLAVLLGAGGWYATEAFPVHAPVALAAPTAAPAAAAAQQGAASAPAVPRSVTPENPIPRRIFATPIPYPLELAGTGFESALSVRVVLNAAGAVESAVAGARAVASPGREPAFPESEAMERFAAAAVEAIGRWQYAPPAEAPLAFHLAVVFKPGVAAVVTQSDRPQGVHAGPAGARMTTTAEQAALEARLSLSALAEETRARAGAGARSGGPFAPSTGSPGSASPGASAGSAAPSSEFRPRGAALPAPGTAPRGAAVPGPAPGAPNAAAVPGPGTAQPPKTASPSSSTRPRPPALQDTVTVRSGGPVRVGGSVMAPNQIRKVQPVYPEEARAAGVKGVVILEAIIDQQGRVSEVRVLRSLPLLDEAAIDAVRQWEYTPTMLNGLPVPIVMTVTVQFALE